jgi:hypothetical protein
MSMTLNDHWQAYQSGGYDAARVIPPADAPAAFYLALLAFADDDAESARAFAQQAARREPACRLYAQAAVYLDRVCTQGKADVYVDGDAFAAFIRGGGNVGLYAAASDALRAIYRAHETEHGPLSLLDIGVGDGLALLPALTSGVTRLDLVEPSAAMLKRTMAALEARGVNYHAVNSTLQTFVEQPAGTWDIVQATWSLQSVPPEERPAMFGWLRAHGQRVLIAEFDVPALGDTFEPQRVAYITERYERGLAEYDGDGGIVAQGFLMPVLFGYFDRSEARTNWEVPIREWVDLLHAAGFVHVEARALYAYFWADAYLIEAR